jgi:hypothetical protein
MEALSQLPNLRHLFLCTLNGNEAERERRQSECFRLLPNLLRADDYFSENTNHNILFSMPRPPTELKMEHLSLRYHLPEIRPPCRMANVRSLRLFQITSLNRWNLPFMYALNKLTSLHASRLDEHVLRLVLVGVGGRLKRLTLHEQQYGGSLSDIFQLCPRLEVFHSSFCTFAERSADVFPVDRLRHLELDAQVGDVVPQLLRAPLLEHLHFFALYLTMEDVGPLVHLLAHNAILTRLHTLAVFKRNANVHGRCLVDNIILHCQLIADCIIYC